MCVYGAATAGRLLKLCSTCKLDGSRSSDCYRKPVITVSLL